MSNIPIAYSISDAARVTSLKRTKLYQLINAGQIDTFKIGRRRLIKASSLHNLLELSG